MDIESIIGQCKEELRFLSSERMHEVARIIDRNAAASLESDEQVLRYVKTFAQLVNDESFRMILPEGDYQSWAVVRVFNPLSNHYTFLESKDLFKEFFKQDRSPMLAGAYFRFCYSYSGPSLSGFQAFRKVLDFPQEKVRLVSDILKSTFRKSIIYDELDKPEITTSDIVYGLKSEIFSRCFSDVIDAISVVNIAEYSPKELFDLAMGGQNNYKRLLKGFSEFIPAVTKALSIVKPERKQMLKHIIDEESKKDEWNSDVFVHLAEELNNDYIIFKKWNFDEARECRLFTDFFKHFYSDFPLPGEEELKKTLEQLVHEKLYSEATVEKRKNSTNPPDIDDVKRLEMLIQKFINNIFIHKNKSINQVFASCYSPSLSSFMPDFRYRDLEKCAKQYQSDFNDFVELIIGCRIYSYKLPKESFNSFVSYMEKIFEVNDDFAMHLCRKFSVLYHDENGKEKLEEILSFTEHAKESCPFFDVDMFSEYVNFIQDGKRPSDKLHDVIKKVNKIRFAESKLHLPSSMGPEHYNKLQANTLKTLISLIAEENFNISEGSVLDAGCGGGMFSVVSNQLAIMINNISSLKIVGIDKDYKKVESAERNYENAEKGAKALSRSVFCQADLKDLVVFGEKYGLVLCNQVLHWVESDEGKLKVLQNFYDSLKDNGILAISVSGTGCCEDFLNAYQAVLREHGGYNKGKFRKDTCEGYDDPVQSPRSRHVDPIGNMNLSDLRRLIDAAGFDVLNACHLDEKVIFEHAIQYAEAVRNYGYEEFLKPFDNLDEGKKEELWNGILEKYEKITRSRAKGYAYHQFTNYVIAIKRHPG